MIFREANSDDIGGLFEVWTTCFTDDYPYIEKYFEYCFPYTKTLVATTDSGEIVSSITLIPATAEIRNETINGYYLYAVGTKPEHRGFSLSLSLINMANQICRDQNLSFLITRPATESLYDLYERYGFTQTLYEEQIIEPLVFPGNHSLVAYTSSISTLSLYNFEKSRNTCGNKFLWSKEVLNYILLEISERGGFCMFAKERNDSPQLNYFITYPEPENIETILVLETNFEESNYSFLYRLVSNLYPQAKEIKIIRPNNSLSDSNKLKRSGLLFPIKKGCDVKLKDFSLLLPME